MSMPRRGASPSIVIVAIALAVSSCDRSTDQTRSEPQKPSASTVLPSEARERTQPTPTEGANAADTAKASDLPMQ